MNSSAEFSSTESLNFLHYYKVLHQGLILCISLTEQHSWTLAFMLVLVQVKLSTLKCNVWDARPGSFIFSDIDCLWHFPICCLVSCPEIENSSRLGIYRDILCSCFWVQNKGASCKVVNLRWYFEFALVILLNAELVHWSRSLDEQHVVPQTSQKSLSVYTKMTCFTVTLSTAM